MARKIFVICIITVVVVYMVSCKQDVPTHDITATVVFMKGNVTVNDMNTSVGATIKFGDVIKTSEDSLCRIQIGDKNVLQLGKSSELVFNISEKSNILLLKKGWLGGITRKMFTKQGTYRVETPTVVASIRGTSFCVVAQSDVKSYFCVCNGKINLKGSDAESGNEVIAAHHKGLWYEKNKRGAISIKEAGLLFHDDKGLEELAISINEKIDWTSPDIH